MIVETIKDWQDRIYRWLHLRWLDWGMAVIVSLINAICYLIILPDQLTYSPYGMDQGDFLSAILTGGIAHPSGYPTYLILGRLLQGLPWGGPLAKGQLLSWLSLALASGCLTLWFYRGLAANPMNRLAQLFAGLICGLAFGLSPLVVSHAVVVEVHGLQMLFLSLICWWIRLNLDHSTERPVWQFYILAGLAGLSIGNHITILLLVPVFLWVGWRRIRETGQRRHAAVQAGLFLGGTIIYLYLPLAAGRYPPVNWGNPQTLSGFWWVVSGAPYQGLLSPPAFGQIVERASRLIPVIAAQFGWPGFLLGGVGIFSLFKTQPRLAAILLYIPWVYSVFTLFYSSLDSSAYLLPVCLVGSVGIGLGVLWLSTWHWCNLPLGGLMAAGIAVSLGLQIPSTLQKVDSRGDTSPAQFAQAVLQAAPNGALIITSASEDTFPLWYEHFGLKERPDVRIIVLPLTQYKWYQQTLTHTYPDLAYPELSEEDPLDASWGDAMLAANGQRSICTSRLGIVERPDLDFDCTQGK